MTSAKTKLVLVSLVLCCCSNRAISGEIGRRFAGLGKEVGACIDQQAQLVAPKAVDLETASVAVIGRCKVPIAAFRQFVYTSFPNFHPDQEWWSKELEPEFLKRAREAVALARTKPDQVIAGMKKVDGYDGYKFGMTLDQALQIKPFAKQKTPCGYKGVPVCLEYATAVSGFPARVDIQFEGSAPLLSRILLTISSFEESVRHTCAEVGKVVLGLLADKYGKDPVVDDRKTTWTSPDGGSISLLTLCVHDRKGINVIGYEPSGPL